MKRGVVVRYFKIDLCELPRVKLIGKERLHASRMHYTHALIDQTVYVVTKGELRLLVNGAAVTLRAGDVYLFQKGDMQAPNGVSECEYYYLHYVTTGICTVELEEEAYVAALRSRDERCRKLPYFEPACYDQYYVYIRQHTHIESKGLLEYVVGLLKGHMTAPESRVAERRLAISYAVTKMFLKLESASAPKTAGGDLLARKVADYIDKNYARPLSGEEIAGELFLSFDYINRVFKRNMGVSIIKYRNDVRIQRAKASMFTANKSLGEIATEVGFESVYYFSRVFKKNEGMSPLAYKKKVLRMQEENYVEYY